MTDHNGFFCSGAAGLFSASAPLGVRKRVRRAVAPANGDRSPLEFGPIKK